MMWRPFFLVILLGAAALVAFWLLLQTPGSLADALAHPFTALAGTSQQLNSKLLEVSESADPVRAAGERLLQPLGMLRLVRIYDASDEDRPNKKP